MMFGQWPYRRIRFYLTSAWCCSIQCTWFIRLRMKKNKEWLITLMELVDNWNTYFRENIVYMQCWFICLSSLSVWPFSFEAIYAALLLIALSVGTVLMKHVFGTIFFLLRFGFELKLQVYHSESVLYQTNFDWTQSGTITK